MQGASATKRAMQKSWRVIDGAKDTGGHSKGSFLPSPKPENLVFLVRVMDCDGGRPMSGFLLLPKKTAE